MLEDKPILQLRNPDISTLEKKTNPQSDSFIYPTKKDQIARLDDRIKNMKNAFISSSPSEGEIEKVLVLEVVGSKVHDLQNAIKKVGFEWLGEVEDNEIEVEPNSGFLKKIDISEKFFKTKEVVDSVDISKILFNILKQNKFISENYEGSSTYYWNFQKGLEDFKEFIPPNLKNKQAKIIDSLREKTVQDHLKLKGRVFLFMSNKEGHDKLLKLWEKHKNNGRFEKGLAKWRDLFECLSNIRYWDEKDRLNESDILSNFREDISIQNDNSKNINFELEFWYKKSEQERRANEINLKKIVKENNGDVNGVKFYEKHVAQIHLAKVNLPVSEVKKALDDNFNSLFKYDQVKFFRSEGQNIPNFGVESFSNPDGLYKEYLQEKCNNKPPFIALLDGLPLEKHEALDNRLIIDDPDNFAEKYLVKNRKHGTSMASLICHGDLEKINKPLKRKIYVRPIMEGSSGFVGEEIPKDIFLEDMIERSVRRIFEKIKNENPVYPTIRVINLSICHRTRWFYQNISSGGRLLDWLSWKYKVLFCVSAGNFLENISSEKNQSKEELSKSMMSDIIENHRLRRILMPSDSLNSITVGALHQDEVKDFKLGSRIDILYSETPLPSPISSFGHGFRSSIKPEILFPGGRQMYEGVGNHYEISKSSLKPGQRVATAHANKYNYTRGTSNANALATRSVGLIFEMLDENNFNIPKQNEAVVLKALLVHSARWGEHAKNINKFRKHQLDKEGIARYLGFGIPDITKVMSCTEKRITALGFGEIEKDTEHKFKLPLPQNLRGSKKKRTLTITLAWFTPINPFNSKYKVAQLEFTPPNQKKPLYLNRKEVSSKQATRGTVQHEVLSAIKEIDVFSSDEEIIIPISCKEKASSLTGKIPYGLAITLETTEDINIYTEIKEELRVKEKVMAKL